MSTASAWWQQAIGYEVYLPSFADGNGDGWGDLPGLIDHLDYLSWLGVDLLWVSPFFVSPMADHGYDIADYLNVDPSFGTLADVDRLIADARSRGIRVIADLVVNHTSSRHPWFTASRTDRDSPYRDYYLWRPGRGDEPPNNWVATFGGRAWTHDPASDEWYLHLFTPDQPDLNWSNPKVADEVDAIMRFWLDRGLAGFRVDTAHYLAKHPELPDNPLLPTDEVPTMGGAVADWYRYDHRHDIGQPQLHDIHRRWRTLADDYNAFLVGETHVLDPHRLAEHLNDQSGLHSTFYFGLVQQDPSLAAELIRTATTASAQLSWPQSSHDWTRPVTRYGGRTGGAAAIAGTDRADTRSAGYTVSVSGRRTRALGRCRPTRSSARPDGADRWRRARLPRSRAYPNAVAPRPWARLHHGRGRLATGRGAPTYRYRLRATNRPELTTARLPSDAAPGSGPAPGRARRTGMARYRCRGRGLPARQHAGCRQPRRKRSATSPERNDSARVNGASFG